MRNIPIEVLLSFPKPNYVNPETQGESLIIVNSVLAGLVLLAVTLRLYTRIFLKRWVGSDDYAIIFATIFTLGLNVAVILANARFYWDRHIWDIPFDEIHSVGKIAMAAKALFVCAAFFTRLSLLCFYYRLTVDTGLSKYRWTLHGAMLFNLCIFLAFLPQSIFLCRPVRAYWEFGQGDKCVDEGATTLAAGIVNCVADLLVTVLPIPMIMRLKMPLQQRLSVCVLLGLGIIVTAAGIVRTYFIWKALVDTWDQTWYAYPLWICAAVEIDLAVLCACAPTLRPLLIKLTKPILSSFSSMYDKGVSGYGSRSRSRSRGLGVLSSNATEPTTLDGNTVINSHVDYELEKIDATVDVQESSRPAGPVRKWSQSWKQRSDEIEPAVSPRLVINASQTFEVRHEDRSQLAATMRPSQDSYMRLDDSAHALRNQWLGNNRSPADKYYGHRPNVSCSNGSDPQGASNIKFSAHPSSAPLSPSADNLEEGRLATIDSNTRINQQDSPANGESFFISAPSNDDSTASTTSAKSGQWPLRPATAESSRPELRNGERRWDIERNPFRDGHKVSDSQEIKRATTSPRPDHRTRWGSSPDVWEDIEARKKSLSIERSNSRKEQVKGVSRML